MEPKIELTGRGFDEIAGDAQIVFLYEGEPLPRLFEPAVRTLVDDALVRARFTAAKAQLVSVEFGSGRAARTVVVAGLGAKAEVTAERLRYAAAGAMRAVIATKAKRVAARLPQGGPTRLPAEERALGIALGLKLGAYRFQRYITDSSRHRVAPREVVLSGADDRAALAAGVRRADAIAAGTSLARDLVNEPPGVLTPAALAKAAQRMAHRQGIRARLFDRRQLERLRMAALLAVAKGSVNAPYVVHMTYRPRGEARARLAFVGKGVTFDTGGYNLKLAEHILDMKSDMAGAAAVVGALDAIARLRLPVEVHGLFGAVENMVSGHAFLPDDILQSRSGKTIEVNNTDAEGRLVLADLLDYTCTEIEPDLIVDLATLTGACVVALGTQVSAVMSNGDETTERVRAAALRAGERIWPLPLVPDYFKQFDSHVADFKNAGTRYGGAITAGLFLQQFVRSDTPWAHLDIAGPAFYDTDHPYWGVGGTGAGVNTLVEIARSF